MAGLPGNPRNPETKSTTKTAASSGQATKTQPTKTAPAERETPSPVESPAENKENKLPSTATLPDTSEDFLFEDLDKMPGAAELSAETNPFQEKVNELAKTGKASSVVRKDRDVEAVRNQIRRAANNINMSGKTKVVELKDRPGFTRIFFAVEAKKEKNASGAA